MMRAVHNATINRATKNAARNEREEMFIQMKPLLAKLIYEVTDKDTSNKEKRAIYAGVKMKALTIIHAHNNMYGNVVRFSANYLDRMIRAFIIEHLHAKELPRQTAVRCLLPLMPIRFRIKCWWRRLFA